MSAIFNFMKTVNSCKDVSIRKMNSEDGQVYSVCNYDFLVLRSTTVFSQNINKQIVNIALADKTLADYSFLSRYHYTKSKNYLKRRYRIRHRIPMFIGTPYRLTLLCKNTLLI